MHRGIVAIATILSAIGGFILGRIFERSRIVRQLEETKSTGFCTVPAGIAILFVALILDRVVQGKKRV